MTVYDRGDMVLVGFVFSDELGRKLRPAIVISSAAYNRARQEVIVAAVTSNVRRCLFGDYLIANWKEAGLLFPSVAQYENNQANNDREEARFDAENQFRDL